MAGEPAGAHRGRNCGADDRFDIARSAEHGVRRVRLVVHRRTETNPYGPDDRDVAALRDADHPTVPVPAADAWMTEVVNATGQNVSDQLLAEGHALPYNGTGPRPGG